MTDANQNELDQALFAASAEKDDAAKVASLLAKGANPDARHGMDGSTPLMAAMSAGHLKNAKALLAASDLAVVDNDGWTPLMRAAAKCAAMIPALLPMSDVRARDKMGRTPLMVAARSLNKEAITLLMPLGGMNERAHNGMSAMDWATEKSSSGGFSTVRHIKAEAARLGIEIEAKPAVIAEAPARRRGL